MGEIGRSDKGFVVSKNHSIFDIVMGVTNIRDNKKNNEDIRLFIDYRRVNKLTRLMVYLMPLINELLQYMDKTLWYRSLDMASEFWVVDMTSRDRMISAFITPSGLFEWFRMPFGLKKRPADLPAID